jgi:hypothetical protein
MSTRKKKQSHKLYLPKKYFSGLSKTKKIQRKKEIQTFGSLHWKNPKAYVGFKTNKGIKTKKSQYTKEWNKLFPDAKSLKEKSQATGVPERFIQESYDRGLAAWRTGHRPGANPQQWGYARVSSFLLCGKTHYGPDSDLVRKAKAASAKARTWWSKQCKA